MRASCNPPANQISFQSHLSGERPKEPKTGRDIEIREIGRKPIPTENPVSNAQKTAILLKDMEGSGMKKILMLTAVILALGTAAAIVQIFFSPLVYAGCPTAPPP
jgi:hypothetical protein